MTAPLPHPVVTRDRWREERRRLLVREKALTRQQDEIARERRALPWVRVDTPYVFDTPDGPRRLGELFDGRSQLIVQHFMLGPGWDAGCPSCSFMADHTDGMTVHLAARDIAFVAISRAPLAEITRFRDRMGWRFRWVSSFGNGFNQDFGVSFSPEDVARGTVDYNDQVQAFPSTEAPGISVFVRDDSGAVFHTYATHGRGVEAMMGSYVLMDLTPQGRGERDVPYRMNWVRHHDRYEEAPAPTAAAGCCTAHG